MKHSSLSKNILLVLTATIFGYCLKYYAEAMISSSIGAAEFGDFKLAIRVLFLCNSVLLFGQDYNLVFFMSRYKVQHEKGLAHGYLIWLKDIFIYGTLFTLIIASIFQILHLFHPALIYKYIHFDHPLFLMLFVVPLYALFKLGKLFHLYRKDYAKSMIPSEFSFPALFFILTLITLSLDMTFDSHFVVMLFGISLVLTVILQWGLALTPLQKIIQSKPEQDLKYWISYSRPTWMVSILLISTKTVAMASLELLSTGEAILGYFAAISTIIYSYYVITEPLEFFLRPIISPHVPFQPVDPNIQQTLNKCQLIRIGCIITIVSSCIFFGHQLLGWFGPSFAKSQPELILASILFGTYVFFRQSLDILAYSGQQKWLSKAITFRVLSIFILSIILIPKYHLLGAVLADGIPAASLGIFGFIKLHQSTNLRLLRFT